MKLEPVGLDAAPRVQRVLEQSPAYFSRVEGRVAGSGAGIETLTMLPPNHPAEKKQVFLLIEQGREVGVVDLLRDHGYEGDTWLGLLLLIESKQGAGQGRRAYALVEDWVVQNWKARRIRLAVAEPNPVQEFWVKQGFSVTGETRPHEQGERRYPLHLMHKGLTGNRVLPSLVGERVWVRYPRLSDAADLADYFKRNTEYFAPWDPVRPEGFCKAEFWKDQLARALTTFDAGVRVSFLVFQKDALYRKEPGALLGRLDVTSISGLPLASANLGYSMDQEAAGKGMMTEAVRLVVDYLFRERNLHRIEAGYQVPNMASARVLEKLGFQKEGVAPKMLFLDGKWQDIVRTSLINECWQNLPNAEK